MKRDFKKNKGVAALLITVILSLIMVIFIVGLTIISTRELRQSSQLDQSARALYGAEAGVQDALVQLRYGSPSNPPGTFRESCASEGVKPINVSNFSDQLSSDAIAWVCRDVTDTGSQVEGTLAKDQAVQFNLVPGKVAEAVTSVEVEYAKPIQGSNLAINGPDKGNCFYPGFLSINCGSNPDDNTGYNPWIAPPAIELGLTWWPWVSDPNKTYLNPVTIYNKDDDIIGLPIRNILVMPNKADQPQSNINGNPGEGMSSVCNGTDYICHLEWKGNRKIPLNELTSTSVGQSYILRIKPRYVGTNYRLTFYKADGNRIDIKFPFVVIDVTGRSGDTYRRIKAFLPLAPDSIYNNLDNVLVSGTEICKTLQVDINHSGIDIGGGAGYNFCNGRRY